MALMMAGALPLIDLVYRRGHFTFADSQHTALYFFWFSLSLAFWAAQGLYSRAFYAAVFGAIKRGAIAVPLFTLFGPAGVRLRVADCTPRLIVANSEKAPILEAAGPRVVVANDAFFAALDRFPPRYDPDTAADQLPVDRVEPAQLRPDRHRGPC